MTKQLSLRVQVEQLEKDKARLLAEAQEFRGYVAREEKLRARIKDLEAKLEYARIDAARLQGHLDGTREQLDRAAGRKGHHYDDVCNFGTPRDALMRGRV